MADTPAPIHQVAPIDRCRILSTMVFRVVPLLAIVPLLVILVLHAHPESIIIAVGPLLAILENNLTHMVKRRHMLLLLPALAVFVSMLGAVLWVCRALSLLEGFVHL